MLEKVPTNIFNFTIFPIFLQTSLIPQFSHGDTPRPSLKRGRGRSRREDGGKKRGGCVMAVVTRIALHHLLWLYPPGNHKVVCFQLFPSEVSRRFDEVTAAHRGSWPVATASYHRPNHSSEFRIDSCQCPKTWLYRKTNVYQPLSHDQRIKIHHSCSCKLSVVHTIWRRNSLTIDMFKFTDVTASHV